MLAQRRFVARRHYPEFRILYRKNVLGIQCIGHSKTLAQVDKLLVRLDYGT
jgi:hypothetical protein